MIKWLKRRPIFDGPTTPPPLEDKIRPNALLGGFVPEKPHAESIQSIIIKMMEEKLEVLKFQKSTTIKDIEYHKERLDTCQNKLTVIDREIDLVEKYINESK